jgi:hypothetical protein
MRLLIIAALLMPPTASAPLDPADKHLLTNETSQQAIFLKPTAPNQNAAPDLSMFIALAPEMKPITSSEVSIKTQNKQTRKLKNVRVAKGKKNSQRMNLLTVLMIYKGSKKR